MESASQVSPSLPFSFLHQYSIMSEYNLIMKYHPPGVYVLPSLEEPGVWFGMVTARNGYYSGGVFPFKLIIPADFPSSQPPKIFLACGFYHPLVNPNTGELDLGSEFEKWVPGTSHIYHILHYLRCAINDFSPEVLLANEAKKPPNVEVSRTLMSEPEKFEIRARSYVEDHSLWSSTDFSGTNELSSPLSVLGWQNDTFISLIRDKVANSSQPFTNCSCCSNLGSRGYSWIDPSKMTLFSPRLLCDEKPD